MNWNDVLYSEARRKDFLREAEEWRRAKEARKSKPQKPSLLKQIKSQFVRHAEEPIKPQIIRQSEEALDCSSPTIRLETAAE
ncbi:MAG TPA: hypothetical protein VJZ27_11640 [Aggregatilineales bacterium]|nr:hypothetical protein [Aggregatilineales bacterium]